MNHSYLKKAIHLALTGETIEADLTQFEDLTLPDPYYQEETTIYRPTDTGPVIVTKNPFKIISRVRDKRKGRWGYLITWVDPDGNQHFAIIFESDLHTEGVQKILKSRGLGLMPGQGKHFALIVMQLDSTNRINITSHMGWDDEEMRFIGENDIIEAEYLIDNEITAFVPEKGGKTNEMDASGTLKEWQEHVAIPCSENPLFMFSILAAFAASILRFAGIDVGGYNLFGLTSRGKTSMLQAFASVSGNGSDPNSGRDSSIRRWDATANGIEGIAAKHHDIGLPMDEIGAKDPKDIRFVLYNLFSGRGKEVMNSLRQLVKARSWRTLVLSSGEIQIREVLAENGDDVKGGQLVRLADIPIDGANFPPGVDASEQVRAIKKATAQYYGTALPAFIRELVNLKDEDQSTMSAADISELIRSELDYWNGEIGTEGLTPEQQRVQLRFALTLTAGVMARDLGVLPYSEESMINCVKFARDQWLLNMRETDPSLQGVINIATFVLEHSDRIIDYTEPRSGRELILIPDQLFNSACGRVPSKKVTGKLSELGLLHRQERNRAKSTFTIDGVKKRYYALKPDIKVHYQR